MMAVFRQKVLFTQIRQIYKNAVKFEEPVVDLASETKAYQDVLPEVIDKAVNNPKLKEPEIKDFLREFMEYTLTDRTQGLGFTTAMGYHILEKPENITNDSLYTARVMGWCVEMVQAYFFMLDDILDDSPTRFGKKCWHQLPDIGLKGINDGFLIHTLMADLARTCFGQMPYYSKMKEIFRTTVLKILIGQHMDCRTKTTSISYNRFATICKYKTTSCFIDFPTQLIFLLLKDNHFTMNKDLSYICSGLGIFLQMRNDFFDVYGDEKLYGKSGTDIQEGKCSWLSAVALERCTASQRSLFKECYGTKEPENIKRVKQLYDDLKMPRVYQHERYILRKNLLRRISTLSSNRLKTYFNYKGIYNN